MNLSEAEKRMIYQVEGTSQGAALNEIYMTWRYAPDKAMKDTAEGLLKKLRPLSDKECMDVIRDVQKNYRLPGKARTIGEMLAEARQQSGAQKMTGHDMMEDKKEVDKVILTGAELSKYFGKETTPREMKDQIIKLLDDWKGQQKEHEKPEKKNEQEK